jgi:carbamate kinase
MFIMATDADAVYLDWGTENQRAIRQIGADALERFDFAAGSMGPKVTAAIDFARASGHPAVIGRLEDVDRILTGEAGTMISAGDTPARFY